MPAKRAEERRTGFSTAGGTDYEREDEVMTQLAGTFQTMSWDEEQYDAAPGHPKFTHARVTHELRGEIQGEASICYLLSYRPDHAATFVGFAMVTGKVAGKSGSFVMQDVGTFENGVAKGRWTILPGLGSGELRAIRGDGHFAASAAGASYLLDVTL
jgi:hypothetical protein